MKPGSRYDLYVANKIRILRQRAGMTQKQLAEAMGVTESLIRAYESGRRHPKLTTIGRFSKALGCSPSDLLPTDSLLNAQKTDAYTGEDIPLTQEEQEAAEKAVWLENIGYFYDMLNTKGREAAFTLIEGVSQIPRFQRSTDDKAE